MHNEPDELMDYIKTIDYVIDELRFARIVDVPDLVDDLESVSKGLTEYLNSQ